jgi:branched-chain amino acid transport system substrate-binding protein
VITASAASPGVALSPTTVPFTEAYTKKFRSSPSYDGYTTYDEIYYVTDAIKRAGSADPDKVVDALEKTDYVGTIGRIQFYGKDDEFTHAMKYGKDFVTGVEIQWQNGKQVCIWPADKCDAKLTFPSFVKLPQQTAAQ